MGKLWKLEWKKLLSEKKSWSILGACVLLVLLMTMLYKGISMQSITDAKRNYALSAQGQEEQIAFLQSELGKYEKSREDKINRLIDLFEQQKTIDQNMVAALSGGAVKDILFYEIKETELQIYAHSANLLMGSSIGRYREQLPFLQYLYENEIYMPNLLFQYNGYYMLYLFATGLLPFLLPILVLLITCGTVTDEKAGDTLKFLLQQPYSRAKTLVSKFLVCWCSSMAILLTVCVFLFAVSSLLGGTGDYRYPVKLDTPLPGAIVIGESAYTTLAGFLLSAGIHAFFACILYCAAGLLFSVVCPNTLSALLLSAVAVAIPLAVTKTAGVDMLETLHHAAATTITGYLLCAAAFMGLSVLIFRRKNIYS